MKIIVSPGTEIRKPGGLVVAKPGDVLDLSDSQKFGWPLYEIDQKTNSVIRKLE